MRVGAIFPQVEFGADPVAIRDYAQAAEGLGYRHILAYDHVLGADPAERPGWDRYTHTDDFQEVFVLFGFMAAAAPSLEFVTGVLILPQRQTALVAKQAAQVDVLSGGKFRLGVGVGWNAVEYDALGVEFRTRGRRCDEQIRLLRELWRTQSVTFAGEFDQVDAAGISPLPVQRPIPIWIGGDSEAAMRRVARHGDGWIPHGRPDNQFRARLEALDLALSAAGRDRSQVGVEARINLGEIDEHDWAEETERWRDIGVTHLGVNTMDAGCRTAADHLAMIERFARAIGLAS